MLQKEIEEFHQLFDKTPQSALYHIHNSATNIDQVLTDFAEQIDGILTSQDINDIDLRRFRLKDRNFEYAIVTNCLGNIEHKDRFITNIYHSLENSAFIIILEKKGSILSSEIIELLDKNNFRAVNEIPIFSEYTLVMAKKLHMWGAGQ